jgi:diketogulonate reductase-like aldo/keto reductase
MQWGILSCPRRAPARRHAAGAGLTECRCVATVGSGRFPSPSSRGGRVLADIAGRRGVSPRAVALAFLLRSDSVFVIPKAARPKHVEDNAAAGDLELDPDEVRRIDEAFPRGKPKAELPTL